LDHLSDKKGGGREGGTGKVDKNLGVLKKGQENVYARTRKKLPNWKIRGKANKMPTLQLEAANITTTTKSLSGSKGKK